MDALLHRNRALEGFAGAVEGHHESVAGWLHLFAFVGDEDLAQSGEMLDQHLPSRDIAERTEHLGRRHEVRE
jgi:hypothetical protein